MSDGNNEQKVVLATQPAALQSSLVIRSTVTPGLEYEEYRENLREDFTYSCAYCTTTEYEAQTISMTIDHYEPKNACPKLINDYGNLMYCCRNCNTLKGDLCPPEVARKVGHRFFRPDLDYRHEHFAVDSQHSERLIFKTVTGQYSIDFLELNRPDLTRLRSLRERLYNCHEFVVHGILGIKHFSIDRLPQALKGRAFTRIKEWERMAVSFGDKVDDVLRGIAYSANADRDTQKEARAEERAAKLKNLEGIFPGEPWRAPRKKRKAEPARSK